MKMTKQKVFVVALVVCLAAIVSMGSLAWFTAQDSVTNKFLVADSDDDTPGKIFAVDVYEQDGSIDPETSEPIDYQDGIVYDDILPGDELTKDAIVKNTGLYDQYVRVIITISDRAVWEAMVEEAYPTVDFDDYDIRQHFIGFDATKWDLVHSTMDNTNENDTIQYVLYYTDILAVGDSFSVFTGVEIPEALTVELAEMLGADGAPGFTIDVKAQAVQTENVGASCYEAFATVGMSVN